MEQNERSHHFTCGYCKLSFTTAPQYCTHLKIHTKRKNFSVPCCFCQQEFKSLESFQSHISRYHHSQRSSSKPRAIKTTRCSLCDCQIDSRDMYISHLSSHFGCKDKESPEVPVVLSCSIGTCKSKLDSKKKLFTHMSRYHAVSNCPVFTPEDIEPSLSDEENMQSNDDHTFEMDLEPDVSVEPENEIDEDPYPEHVIIDEIGQFYLKLEGKHLLPTLTVQDIASEIKLLTELSHHRLKKSLEKLLEEAGLNEKKIMSIIEKAFLSDPVYNVHHKDIGVEHFTSHHLRSKFWQQRYPYVEPREIYFGVNEAGRKKRAMHVPIKETLKVLLKNQKIKQMVKDSFIYQDKPHFEDYTDGDAYREHRLQHNDGKCIQILLFQDAFQNNPFGSSKYKPLGFYYILGNMNKEYRSKVDLIQMVFLVMEKDTVPTDQEELDGRDILREAMKAVLEELEDLKLNGIEIDGETIPVCLMFLIGDSLGQHTMGGFVKSFACEFSCRFCPLSKKDFLANPNTLKPLRTPEDYNCNVKTAQLLWKQKKNSAVKEALKAKKRTIARCKTPASKALLKKAISKSAMMKLKATNFRGVKYRPSPFNSEVTKFHVCSGPSMPCCLGHDVFEGIVKCILPRVLKYCICSKEWFDLQTLNRRINHFKCKGTDARDCPKPLKSLEDLNGNICENWNLLRLLPFIIGDLIKDQTDEVWQVYLLLKEIVEMVCAPKISMAQICYLRNIIGSYLNNVKKMEDIFYKCLIPKQHWLCHYPDLIKIFGPLIYLFTLRFESRHIIFKDIIRMCKNYIHLLKTMARKYMCRFAYDHASGLLPPDVISKLSDTLFINMSCLPPAIAKTFPPDFNSTKYDVYRSINVKGTEYSQDDLLILSAVQDTTSLEVGWIKYIFLNCSNDVSFLIEVFEAENSFMGYYTLIKKPVEQYRLVCHENLVDFYPLPTYEFLGNYCFSLKHSILD